MGSKSVHYAYQRGPAFTIDHAPINRIWDGRLALAQHGLAADANLPAAGYPGFPRPRSPLESLAAGLVGDAKLFDWRDKSPPSGSEAGH